LLACDLAQQYEGVFLLRIEDIDRGRSKAAWENQIYDDLSWLGLRWPLPVWRQSDRLARYQAALQSLWQRGLLYPCTCKRRDIIEAASAPQEGAPLHGPDGLIYPGTCRNLPRNPDAPLPSDVALRLDLRAALPLLPARLTFEETGGLCILPPGGYETENLAHFVGDVVLARRDMGTSYHLSVVVDDADQEITDVVRGADLFDATVIHVALQYLLSLPTPRYHHHRLIRDDAGKRLAKRDDARALSKYRAEGASADDIRRQVGL
jgi:glutamyl-Q tRNA(Asp) synthetase